MWVDYGPLVLEFAFVRDNVIELQKVLTPLYALIRLNIPVMEYERAKWNLNYSSVSKVGKFPIRRDDKFKLNF